MSKRNISFNNKNYLVAQSELDEVSTNIVAHLTTSLAGTDTTISFNDVNYDISKEKIDSAKESLIGFLATLPAGSLSICIDEQVYSVGGLELASETIEEALRSNDTWEYPILDGSSLIITQVFAANQSSDNLNVLEVF